MGKHPENNTPKRAFLGTFLIVFGTIWVFERLDLVPQFLNDIIISWQMLLIGIGIFVTIAGNRTTGIILIVFGTVFLIPETIHIPYELRRIGWWPIVLIGIGVIILLKHSGRIGFQKSHSFENNTTQGTDSFEDFVIFGGKEVYIDSQNFLGGKTAAIFGGVEYDFRQSRLSPNGAFVETLALFGGSVFKVPQGWNVKNEVTAIFGAFTDKRGVTLNQITTDPSKTLVIRGFAVFGGVEIKYI